MRIRGWVRVAVGVALAGGMLWRWMTPRMAHADISAQSEIGPSELQTTVCINTGSVGGCNNVASGGTRVKGFKMIAFSANSRCALFNATTTPASNTTKPVDEINEPTAEDTNVHLWPSPINFDVGVSIGIVGADTVCLIYT